MTTDIIDLLPWIDYKSIFRRLEAKGYVEGFILGYTGGLGIDCQRADPDAVTKVVRKILEKVNEDLVLDDIIMGLLKYGISKSIIDTALAQLAS